MPMYWYQTVVNLEKEIKSNEILQKKFMHQIILFYILLQNIKDQYSTSTRTLFIELDWKVARVMKLTVCSGEFFQTTSNLFLLTVSFPKICVPKNIFIIKMILEFQKILEDELQFQIQLLMIKKEKNLWHLILFYLSKIFSTSQN